MKELKPDMLMTSMSGKSSCWPQATAREPRSRRRCVEPSRPQGRPRGAEPGLEALRRGRQGALEAWTREPGGWRHCVKGALERRSLEALRWMGIGDGRTEVREGIRSGLVTGGGGLVGGTGGGSRQAWASVNWLGLELNGCTRAKWSLLGLYQKKFCIAIFAGPRATAYPARGPDVPLAETTSHSPRSRLRAIKLY